MYEKKVLVRIELPQGNYKVISLPPTEKLRNVLNYVCEKSKMDPAEHYLVYNNAPVGWDATVADVKGTLMIKERKEGSQYFTYLSLIIT